MIKKILSFTFALIFFAGLFLPQNAHAVDLTTGLVSYWKLDETSGTRSDSVGTNNLTSNNSVGQTVGKLSNAAQFNSGSSRYLSVADNASVSVGDIDFTVAGWVYLDSKNADQIIASHYFTATNQRSWNLGYLASSDRFRFVVSSDGGPTNVATILANNLGSPSTGTWYYIVAWHDSVANTINIQVNNGAVDSFSWSAGVLDSTGPFTVGALGNPLQYFDGRIDGVSLWKRTLSSGERSSLYNSGSGLEYPFGVGVDTTAPEVTVTAPTTEATVSGSSVILTATSTDNVGVSSVQFKVDNVNVGPSGTTSPYSTTWDSTSVSNGTHSIAAVASDAAGNLATSTITVTVSNVIGPVISSISSGTPTATSTIITWATDVAADSLVEYGLSSTYNASSTFDSSLVTSHSVLISGLAAGHTYHYRVISKDGSSIQTSSTDQTFTAAASSTILTNSIIGYWKLDEASGTRVDSVGGNNLTSNNSTGQAIGKLSNAASFSSASSQYLSIADNPQLSMEDIDFSVSAWVYLNSKSADQGIVGQYLTTTNQRSWNINYNAVTDRFRFAVSADGTGNTGQFDNVVADNLGSPSTGTWYYIVAWHDSVANTINIQVNNGTPNSLSHTTGVLNSTGSFTIGALSNPIQYFDGKIDGVGLWKKVLSSGERTSLYNSGSGLEYPFTQSDGITIVSPSSYQVIQRNGSNQANITVTGTYVGSPTAIEASWNGGAYNTIVANPSGGTFSGTLTNQSVGQGTLSVRYTNDTSISTSKTYVGIGDIFVVAGQSNGSGRAINGQSYSNPTLKASLFGNDDVWKELSDPTDSMVGQVDSVSLEDVSVLTTGFGSVWPLVATLYLADQNVPVAFLQTTKGGTSISQWQPNASNHGDTSTLYGSMYRRINAAGGSVKNILFWQGENDVVAGTSRSAYLSQLNSFVDSAFTDFGVKTIAAQIGPYGAQATTSINNVRLAQIDAWNAGGNILPGPSLYDIDLTADPTFLVHFKTDTEVQTVANRWWAALSKNLYDGADGRGPALSSATYNLAKTQVILTFNDDTLPILPASSYSIDAFIVKDNGVAKTISSVEKVSPSQLKLTLSSAATSGTITVSLGSGNSAEGLTVPTDSGTYNLPAEIFIDQAASLDATAPALSSISSGSPSASSTTLTWTTNESADSQIEYGLSSAYTASTTLNTTLVTSHSVDLVGLAPNTTYHYRVISRDALLNTVSSSDQTFTTAAVPSISSGGGSQTSAGSGWVNILYPTSTTLPTTNEIATFPVPSPDFTRNLTLQSSGEDVKALQKFLILKGFLGAQNATGFFGLLTKTALIKYQRSMNIFPAVGYFGPVTRSILSHTGTETLPIISPTLITPINRLFTRDLYVSMRGNDVRSLQKFLNKYLFTVAVTGPGSPGLESDYFGTGTKSALIKFQTTNDITPATGYFGPKTRSVVNSEVETSN